MDIVDRLRDMSSKKYRSDWATWVQTRCDEAANEIERLRGEVEGADALHEAEKQMHAETKEQVEAVRKDADFYCDQAHKLRSERDSLKEALHYALQAWQYDGVSDEHGSTFREAERRCDMPPNAELCGGPSGPSERAPG